MRRTLCLLVVSLVVVAFAAPALASGRLGFGLHYLNTLGDIKDTEEFDENAFGFLASYQTDFMMVTVEGDVEWIPDYGGTDKALIQPQVYGLLGDFFYGGVGIGWTNFDGEWWDEPFYSLRAGVDFGLGGLDLDAYALYRFQDAEVLEGFGEQEVDSLTFGAQIHFQMGG